MQEQTYKDEITGQTDRKYMTALELSQALHDIEEVIDSIRRFYKAEDVEIEQVNRGIRILRNRVVALSELKEHTHDFDKKFGSSIGMNTCRTCREKRWF